MIWLYRPDTRYGLAHAYTDAAARALCGLSPAPGLREGPEITRCSRCTRRVGRVERQQALIAEAVDEIERARQSFPKRK